MRDRNGVKRKKMTEKGKGWRERELLAGQAKREEKACVHRNIERGRASTSMLRRLQFLLKNSVHRVPPAARVQSTGTREICYRR